MKYKVGDQVRIKSIHWYNKNKNEKGTVSLKHFDFVRDMAVYCGEVLIVESVCSYSYYMKGTSFSFTDEMIECLVEGKDSKLNMSSLSSDEVMEIDLNEYEMSDENGNIINAKKVKVRKKSVRLTDYLACCQFLGISEPYIEVCQSEHMASGYNGHAMASLVTLLICRDAYWKHANNWKPDWDIDMLVKYVIVNTGGRIIVQKGYRMNRILAFPNKEMRDTFYENFRSLIEDCKEFL